MIMTIDTGIPFGWATWSEQHWKKLCRPIHAGVCHVGCRAADWLTHFKLAMKEFHRFFKPERVSAVYFEEPVFFTDGGSEAVAASGSLVKLALTTGGMMELARQYGADIRLAPVRQWKGQLPKRVVQDRICALLKCSPKAYTSHAWDAVGIGLWAKGYF